MKIIKKLNSGSIFSNTYYIDDDIKVVIDAGQLVDEKVDILILTHCHFDHVVHANEIKKKNNCRIYMSLKCSEHLKNLDNATFHSFFTEHAEPVFADKIIKEGDIIKTGRYSLRVIETPGHTDCSICLYDDTKKILFSGDTMFRRTTGRTDLPTGNPEKMLKSLEKLKKLEVKKLYPGH
ncbi:MAG: MBL fold metallo-hydrolase [Candidatus Nanoarchaeia archaeon]|nr:MBL fold metallo-hydrolase [Candidatus Nanoarchaeia archaeon]